VSYRDRDIATRLRAAGLRVVEVAGWTSAGSDSFSPRGSVNHHTAGSSSGATPSLSTCIYGRPDLAGPLCNVYQSREPDGRDIAYVIASGRANHAGEGGWKGLEGNSSVYGLEIEHTGTAPLPQGRIDIAARIHAAMYEGSPSMVCQHYEWAPSRKIDAATNVPGEWFRELVADARSTGGDWLAMASLEEVKTAMRQVLNEGTGSGQKNWPGTNKAILSTEQKNYNELQAVQATLANMASELGTESVAAAALEVDEEEGDE